MYKYNCTIVLGFGYLFVHDVNTPLEYNVKFSSYIVYIKDGVKSIKLFILDAEE